jgi:catechol 2,3-dioxygenase-like lactoylglutathione lyase family enzyme
VEQQASNLLRMAPVLIVESVEKSVAYYRDRLGFALVGSFGDPPEMAFVGRDAIQLMLQDAEGKPRPGSNRRYKSVAWDALVWARDVDALHADLQAREARILKAPHRTFYGHREMEVADLDGHVLCFSQPPAGAEGT